MKSRFGSSVSSFPSLGKRVSSFNATKLPSADDIRSQCLQDAQDTRADTEILPNSSPLKKTTDCAATDEVEHELRISRGLVETHSATMQSMLSFPCQHLENLRQDGKEEQENLLQESMTTCTMLPEDTLLPLQHSNEGTTYITLLSGSLIWIIWPSTEHNIATTKSVYRSFAQGVDDAWIKGVGELEGGVFFQQTQGDGLRVSPFCPMICVSTEASIIASHCTLDANEFVSMLRKLPLLNVWFQTEVEGERKRSEFCSAMLMYLGSILQGDYDDFKMFRYPYKGEGPLHTLLSLWDEVKDNLADMLELGDIEILKEAWVQFIQTAKGRQCWICGTNIYSKKKSAGKHFEDKHWTKMKADGGEPLDKNGKADAIGGSDKMESE
jgi:hypothetical protein